MLISLIIGQKYKSNTNQQKEIRRNALLVCINTLRAAASNNIRRRRHRHLYICHVMI